MTRSILIVTALLVLFSNLPAWASDLDREQRMANEIVDTILDGEPVELTTKGNHFLGIYTESEADNPKGGVIILHGRGYHPDWPNVAQPLRVALPEYGWHTLSLQMPVLGKEAKYFDYVPILAEAQPRLDAGIQYLHDQNISNIILIAHSCSVHMSMDWIRAEGDSGINAFVGIGMGATDYKQPMALPFPLDRMKVPVLDLYGGNDYPAVIRMAPERKIALKNPASQQIQIPDADHYFTDQDSILIETVRHWLDTLDH